MIFFLHSSSFVSNLLARELIQDSVVESYRSYGEGMKKYKLILGSLIPGRGVLRDRSWGHKRVGAVGGLCGRGKGGERGREGTERRIVLADRGLGEGTKQGLEKVKADA